MAKAKESPQLQYLREKIRLKKIDRSVYVDEFNNIISSNIEKRNALRIGNDCLRFMTKRQNDMSKTMNAKIFVDRPNVEKLPMLKMNLANSIVKNDRKVFMKGKKLLIHDYVHQKVKTQLTQAKEELHRTIEEEKKFIDDYHQAHTHYLHKQVQVEDSKSREHSAKLTYKRLQEVQAQLDKDLIFFPLKIRDMEKKIRDLKREVVDFTEMKNGAERFLEMEEKQLEPLNEELRMVTSHFEKLISAEKQEFDDSRKKNSLAKFLADRDAHAFNFTDSNNIEQMKILARNKALVNAQDTVIMLMDTMLINDIKYVVDCVRDQAEVTTLLKQEKENLLKDKDVLKKDLERLCETYSHLMFNDVRAARAREHIESEVLQERGEVKRFEDYDQCLRKQDKLISDLTAAVHASFEKLRPIKIEEEKNVFKGSLVEDAQNLTQKLKKMIELINLKTVSIGRVKPLMFRMFREKRVPADSVRVHPSTQVNIASNMHTLEIWEADQPGFVSREMLKARAEEAAAPKKKKKQK